MGGRGSFAAGISVPYTYKTVGYIDGVKILEGLNGQHSLPASAHSSAAYIKLDHNGNFKEMRFYDKDKCLYLEIAYHRESNLTGNNKEPVLHYHTYDKSFSMTREGKGGRTDAIPITDEMIQKYGRYFKGVNL
ncbi:TPA: hypothetical protein DD394_06780 [bacterium UBP9_UBA11836]|nr:hypothetical protein [bacterium UBP9_UBA11836]